MKNGDLFLENSLISIDGDSEIGEKLLKCHTISLKGKMNSFNSSHSLSFFYSFTDCDVNIKNISIESGAEMKDGRCLELENCSNFVIMDCKLSCQSDTSDLSPYPNRYFKNIFDILRKGMRLSFNPSLNYAGVIFLRLFNASQARVRSAGVIFPDLASMLVELFSTNNLMSKLTRVTFTTRGIVASGLVEEALV